jgi:hypothetical protein
LKLSVASVVLGAIMIPWWNRRRFFSALLVPGGLIASLQVAWSVYPVDLPRWAAWAVWGLNILFYVVFAVVCHRVVLLAVGREHRAIKWTKRETQFIVFSVGIWLLSVAAGWLVLFVVATPTLNIFANLVSDETVRPVAHGMTVAGKVIGAYVMGRLALVLPAAALDRRLTLADSWAATRENGWRLAIVVGALPWVLDALTSFAYREDSGIIESAALAVLCVVTLTVEITALSLSYKQLVPQSEPPKGSLPAGT